MKSFFAAIALVALTMTAHATQPGNNGNGNGGCGVGQQTNGCGGSATVGDTTSSSTSNAVGVGVGIGVGVGLGGNASATGIGGAGGTASAAGGAADANASAQGGTASVGAVGGTSYGNSTSVVVRGAERSAPSIGAAVAPVQVRNCRIGIGFGGTNTSGAFTAAIPLGNDATCLAGAKLEAMTTAGGFSQESMQRVACEIEGMDKLAECKALKAD